MKLNLTYEQECELIYLIGDWYLEWKTRMTDHGKQHYLGIAKEQLINLILEASKNTEGDKPI